MKKIFWSKIQSKKIICGLVCLSSLIVSAIFVRASSQKLNTLTTLMDGINICFSRLGQTYTATLLGMVSSTYTSNTFMTSTEECFAEAVNMLEDTLGKNVAQTNSLLNRLASTTHFFHERLNVGNPILTKKGNGTTAATNRYTQAETAKDDLFSEMDALRGKWLGTQKQASFALFIFALLGVFIMIWEFFETYRHNQKRERLEFWAREELLKEGNANSMSAGKIISEAMALDKLSACESLFSRIQTDFEDSSFGAFVSKPYIEPINFSVPKVLNESITNADPLKNEVVNVSLDETLVKVIDSMASHLFTKGIMLDFKIDDNIWVRGTKEGIEQICFQVLDYYIRQIPMKSGGRKITIRARKNTQGTEIDFIDSSMIFPSDMLDKIQELEDSSLLICRELATEYHGRMTFLNQMGPEAKAVGATIRFELLPGTREKTLGFIRKGKKKDLAGAFQI